MSSTAQMPRQAERAARDAVDTTGRRWLVILVAFVVIGVLVLGAGFAFLWFATADRDDEQNDAIRTLAGQSTQLQDQVRSLGGTPVVTTEQISGPAGVAGERGVAGPVGPPGPAGIPGTTGEPGPAGAPGQTGSPGSDGASGQNGSDGAPGPAGPQGEPGPIGPQGVQGEAGKPPAGFTITDELGTRTCTRDVGSPDDAATYTCVAAADATSSDVQLMSLVTS